jgi:hypothetical protein
MFGCSSTRIYHEISCGHQEVVNTVKAEED